MGVSGAWSQPEEDGGGDKAEEDGGGDKAGALILNQYGGPRYVVNLTRRGTRLEDVSSTNMGSQAAGTRPCLWCSLHACPSPERSWKACLIRSRSLNPYGVPPRERNTKECQTATARLNVCIRLQQH